MKFTFKGFVFEVESKDAIDYFTAVQCTEIMKTHDYLSKESTEAYHKAYEIASDYMDKIAYGLIESDYPFDQLYWYISRLEHEQYFEHSIDDFREYCTHMDEPDFDWDFYSDWHKDLFGHRPR